MQKNKFLIFAMMILACASLFAKEKKNKMPKATKKGVVCVMKIEFENDINRDFYAKTTGHTKHAQNAHTCNGQAIDQGFFAFATKDVKKKKVSKKNLAAYEKELEETLTNSFMTHTPSELYDKTQRKLFANRFLLALFDSWDFFVEIPGPGTVTVDKNVKYVYVGSFKVSFGKNLQPTVKRVDEYEEAKAWLAEQLGEKAAAKADMIRAAQ